MTKVEMNNAVAAVASVSAADADKVISALVKVINDELVAGNKVTVNGLGIFESKTRPERQGFNPLTKEKITIAESKSVAFKPAKALKDNVNA